MTWDQAKRRELTIVNALGGGTTLGYDAGGNNTTEQDELGRLTTMTCA